MLKIIKKYSFLVGIFILIIIFLKIDFNKLLSILSQIKVIPLTFALLLTILLVMAKSYRWNYLKNKQNIPYTLLDSFLIYWIGLAFGTITPGKIGEVVKIYYLKNNGHPYNKALVNVIWDRLLDIITLLIIGSLSLLLFLQFFKSTLLYYFISIILLLLLIILKKQWLKNFTYRIFYLLIPRQYHQKWQTSFVDFWQEMKVYSNRTHLFALAISLLGWLIYYLQVILFGLSINLEIPTLYLLSAVTISALITILPISYLGIGTREAIFVILLSSFVEQKESLILLSEIILLDYILIGIIGGIISIFKPLPLNLKAKK